MIRFLHAHQKKVRAVGLVTAVILCFITSAVTLGFVRFMIGMNDSTRSNLERMVAQTAVSNAVNELEIIEYNKLVSEPRKNVAGMGNVNIDREIIVTGETVNETDGKKKDAIINIYRNGESDPILTLTKTLSSQGSSTGSVPIGAVIAWPVATDPDGPDKNKWLECDGRAVDASKYPKLSAKMSHTPNYAGVFLRGYGSQYSSHYGSVLHQSAALGTLQGDSIRNLYGTFGAVTWFLDSSATGAFYYSDKAWGYDIEEDFGTQWNDIGIATFSATRIVPTANENRPINKAVRYLIRAA